MKILIAADMEGVTGVVHWDQVSPSHPEYPRFRRLMTGDVNAAIRGAFDAGADEVIVTDGHNRGQNILIEELDPRARLNSGSPSPLSMVQGADSGLDGVFFVGYHARIGTQHAILEHTWSDERVANVWINDELFGEIGLNAAVCGHFGAPVLMISGDQAACAEAAALLGDIETAVVKHATGRMSAELLPPQVSQARIQQAAYEALHQLNDGKAPPPLQIPPPIKLSLDLVHSEMADRAAFLPGATRQGRRITYTAQDMPTIYSAFISILGLARG
jgi:D-amino peptidase